MNMQSHTYYRLRYMLAGDLAKAWNKFGGLSGHVNFFGITLRLAITESPFVAMEYDRVTQQRLSAIASDRYNENNPGLDYFVLLPNEQTDVARNIAATSNAFLRSKGKAKGQDNGPKGPNEDPMAVAPGVQPPGVHGPKPKFVYGKGKNKKKERDSPLGGYYGIHLSPYHINGFNKYANGRIQP